MIEEKSWLRGQRVIFFCFVIAEAALPLSGQVRRCRADNNGRRGGDCSGATNHGACPHDRSPADEVIQSSIELTRLPSW